MTDDKKRTVCVIGSGMPSGRSHMRMLLATQVALAHTSSMTMATGSELDSGDNKPISIDDIFGTNRDVSGLCIAPSTNLRVNAFTEGRGKGNKYARKKSRGW